MICWDYKWQIYSVAVTNDYKLARCTGELGASAFGGVIYLILELYTS